MKQEKADRRGYLLLIAVNLICIALIAAFFVNYSSEYRAKLYRQNISSIGDLNRSSGTVAQAVFAFQSQKISDIARYVEAEDMDLEQALAYMGVMGADTRGSLELVGPDGTGSVPADGGEAASISYEDRSYAELHRLFSAACAGRAGAVAYTPEFTDARSAFKSFAFYTYVGIRGETGKDYYTLMFVTRSDEMMEKIQQRGSYDSLATVLMDGAGNYIIGNPDFKSENFFKYLYVFNGLTLDEMNALSASSLRTDAGTLRYSNSEGAPCVFLYSRPEGESWYSVSCVPLACFDNAVPDSRLTVLVTVVLSVMLVMDILWLNRMNRQLKQSVARETQANRAKTEFLSRMSHDIRTPLNAILGFAAITRDSPALAPPLRENLNKIDVSGRYLLGIINDVLDMSKIESGKVELHGKSTDCAEMFSAVLEVFSGEAELRGIALRPEFSFGEARFLVLDSLRTRQIFSNLLSNAIKFSDSGTTVRWTAAESRLEDGRIELVSRVIDQGCGMTPEFLKNVFDPFTQEQNSHSGEAAGTGLGLSIVSRLVGLMGGGVEVTSEPGRGTAFTVTLRFPEGAADAGSDAAARPADAGRTALCGKRVLLCEDNALNREIADTLLASRGLVCQAAENGQLGVSLFSASPAGYYDAILMDVRMPVMNGLKAAAAIRALDRPDAKRVPIIAMTANAYDEDIRECLNAGMNAHLSKPFEPEELFQTLSRCMAGSRSEPA